MYRTHDTNKHSCLHSSPLDECVECLNKTLHVTRVDLGQRWLGKADLPIVL